MAMKNCSISSRRRVKRKVMSSGEEDRFEALPDEIILHILETIKDAKTLVRCLSLSKRFASLASMARFVSLSVHRPDFGIQCFNLTPWPSDAFPDVNLGQNSLHIVGATIILPHPVEMFWPRQVLKPGNYLLTHQLTSLKQIRHLSMRFRKGDIPYRCNDVVRWKLDMSSEFPLGFKSCAVLERNRVRYYCSGLMKDRLQTGWWVKKRVKWIGAMLRLVFEMKPVLGQVMRDHPTVKEVVVRDVKGEIHAGEDMRGAEAWGVEKMLLSMRTWFVPLVELSEPVRRAFEEPDCTAAGDGFMLTVVLPAVSAQHYPYADLVRSAFGDDDGFGQEIAKMIDSSLPVASLAVDVNMGHY